MRGALVLTLLVAVCAMTGACTPQPQAANATKSPALEAAGACTVFCPESIAMANPLFDSRGSGRPDSSFVLAPNSIELHDLHGGLIWKAVVDSSDTPRLITVGDFTGDGITDAVFRTLTIPANSIHCGTRLIASTRLAFIDGADGSVSYPLPPMDDLCWNGFGITQPYPTHQWGYGTAYIGPLVGASSVVVAFPYYATEGWALRWSRQGWMRESGGASNPLVYPSTAAYDRVYDAANPSPCSQTRPQQCYVEDSHVPNAVFLDPPSARGLLVLTSSRAFLYGPDLLPHSDITWISGGRTDNGGRNYGMLERLPGKPMSFLLIGGCSVHNSQLKNTGQPVNVDCAIHHHLEYFQLAGAEIVAHASAYLGYTNTDGDWEHRVEFLRNPSSGFAGDAAAVFNMYRHGQWRLEIVPNPATPQTMLEFPGWYAWDAFMTSSGRPLLLATRAGSGGGDASKVLPWEFDVLDWDGQRPVSILHRDGVVPALFPYPQSEWRHASDGMTYGALTLTSPRGVRLVVADQNSHVSSQLLDIRDLG